MNVEPYPDDFTLRMAQTLGRLGFRVVRVYEGDKRPVGLDWPTLATADVEVLTSQFEPGGVGIGVACGPQPNGRNLVVVDVDVKYDGMANWERIVAEHGPFPVTATHTTPSGGMHLFWDSPETFSNGKLAPGVDIRGQGGQVVVPPSWRLINDERVFYRPRWKGAGIHQHYTSALPIAIWEMLQRPSPVELTASIARHPSQDSDVLTNADWLRDHWEWVAVLEAQGHVMVRQIGRDIYLRHPTATAEHSAVIHLDANMMNAWSTNMPSHPRGLENRDGSIPWSPYDWFVATEHNYDDRSAMAEIYRRRGITVGTAPPQRAGSREPPSINATSQWRLPTAHSDYWSASARNRHILAAARAAMVSPDALDVVVYALESLLIPSNYLLPAIVGGKQPLNFLACLVANTGLFKTSTLDAARDLMGPLPPWVIQIGMGSGEGIGATFLKEETELSKNGKSMVKTGRLVRNDIQAAFFEADEGRSLSEIAARSGATIIANLCKAWSGSTLGEANADLTTRRHVLDRDYRIAALVNIQPAVFTKLFSEANTGTGLTGRFMFSGTLDADIPDERGPDPGLLEHPDFPKMPTTLEIDPTIIALAETKIRRLHRTGGLDSELDAVNQNAAVIARMAGIAVLVDDRRRITVDDWAVAEMRATASAACLATLTSWGVAVRGDARHSEDEAIALSGIRRASITEQADVAKFKGRIIERTRRAGTMSRREIKDLKDTPRDVLWLALDELLAEGLLIKDGSTYRCAR